MAARAPLCPSFPCRTLHFLGNNLANLEITGSVVFGSGGPVQCFVDRKTNVEPKRHRETERKQRSSSTGSTLDERHFRVTEPPLSCDSFCANAPRGKGGHKFMHPHHPHLIGPFHRLRSRDFRRVYRFAVTQTFAFSPGARPVP